MIGEPCRRDSVSSEWIHAGQGEVGELEHLFHADTISHVHLAYLFLCCAHSSMHEVLSSAVRYLSVTEIQRICDDDALFSHDLDASLQEELEKKVENAEERRKKMRKALILLKKKTEKLTTGISAMEHNIQSLFNEAQMQAKTKTEEIKHVRAQLRKQGQDADADW